MGCVLLVTKRPAEHAGAYANEATEDAAPWASDGNWWPEKDQIIGGPGTFSSTTSTWEGRGGRLEQGLMSFQADEQEHILD